jgi:hexulose-6-phosphate isomerase
MYTQVSFWSFRGERHVLEAMPLAKESGFDGMELTIGETGDLTPETPAGMCKALATAAKSLKLKLGSAASGLLWKHNPASAAKATRDKALEVTEACLRVTAELGVSHLLVLTGHVGVPWDHSAEVVDYEECYQRSVEFGKAVGKLAGKAGVTACFENVWNYFLSSPLEFRQFLADVKSPNVGLYLDLGNAWQTGYPQHWIRLLSGSIQRVHVKDYRRTGGPHGFVNLGDGDAPLTECMKLLKKAKYKGPITAEVIPGPRDEDETAFLKETAERLRGLVP